MSDELSLQPSEERYALALEAIGEGFFDWNVTDDAFYYSPPLYAKLGLRTRDD
jgi:hypothetical protein